MLVVIVIYRIDVSNKLENFQEQNIAGGRECTTTGPQAKKATCTYRYQTVNFSGYSIILLPAVRFLRTLLITTHTRGARGFRLRSGGDDIKVRGSVNRDPSTRVLRKRDRRLPVIELVHEEVKVEVK